jgi:hypothetical protein
MKVSTSKAKPMGFCGKSIKRLKLEIEEKIIQKVSYFNYSGYLISNDDDISTKLQRHNKINDIIKGNFGKHEKKKLQIHNITYKATLC